MRWCALRNVVLRRDAEPRDLLHLYAIGAWQALASGPARSRFVPAALDQVIYEAFVCQVDQLCDDWLELASQHGTTGGYHSPRPGRADSDGPGTGTGSGR